MLLQFDNFNSRISTPARSCRCFHSCIFHPCKIVPILPLRTAFLPSAFSRSFVPIFPLPFFSTPAFKRSRVNLRQVAWPSWILPQVIIGLGTQSILGGTTFLLEKYTLKISKMPEFYMILARKIIQIPEFLLYLPEKFTKFLNFTFLPEKCPNFA